MTVLLGITFGRGYLFYFCLVLVEPIWCFQEQKVSETGKNTDLFPAGYQQLMTFCFLWYLRSKVVLKHIPCSFPFQFAIKSKSLTQSCYGVRSNYSLMRCPPAELLCFRNLYAVAARVARISIWKQSAFRHLCPCTCLWWCPWSCRCFCSLRIQITRHLFSSL